MTDRFTPCEIESRCHRFRQHIEGEILRMLGDGVPLSAIWAALDSALDYANLLQTNPAINSMFPKLK